MIEIRIRHAWAGRSAHLCEILDVEEIPKIRAALVEWGIVDVDDPDAALAGQWVVEDAAAYFEFIMIEDS